MKTKTEVIVRPIFEIAREIRRDWADKDGRGIVYFGAEPYLVAMASCDRIDGMYGCDTIKGIVLYFLSNAQTWKGETARRIKTELKGMVDGCR